MRKNALQSMVDPEEKKVQENLKNPLGFNEKLTKKRRSSSMSNLSNSCNSSALFETTMLSLSNNSLEECQISGDMQMEIEKLKLELIAASQKIKALEVENQMLKNELVHRKSLDSDHDREFYAPVTRTTEHEPEQGVMENVTEQLISISRDRNNENISASQDTIDKIGSATVIVDKLGHCLSANNVDISAETEPVLEAPQGCVQNTEETQECINSNNKKEHIVIKCSTEMTTKKILVLGDEQARSTRIILQKLLGSEYAVRSICKPGAQLRDIIYCTKLEVWNFTRNDFIVLAGGSNDRNPFDFQRNLNIWLESVKHTNVIVSEIPFNRHLNEKKLNHDLKFVCSRYSNVTFIDMDYSRDVPNRKYFALSLSRSLVRDVLRINNMNNRIAYTEYLRKQCILKKQPKEYVDKQTQTVAFLADSLNIGAELSCDESNEINQNNDMHENNDNLFRV